MKFIVCFGLLLGIVLAITLVGGQEPEYIIPPDYVMPEYLILPTTPPYSLRDACEKIRTLETKITALEARIIELEKQTDIGGKDRPSEPKEEK